MTTRQIRRAAERAERKRTRTEINRENAQKSTGPKTAEGKSASSRNAFKHGLYSKQVATSREDAAALDALKFDLRSQHQPVNDTEEILVNEMAEQFWRIKRARIMEANFFDAPEPMFTFLAAIQRLMSAAERGLHKSLAALRQLQKDRGFVPQQLEEQPEVTEPEEVTQPESVVPLAQITQKAPNPAVVTRFVPQQPNAEPMTIPLGGPGTAASASQNK